MGYQQIKIPRIYMNVAEFLALKGVIDIDPVFRTLPVNLQDIPAEIIFPDLDNFTDIFQNHFMAILGNEFNSFNIIKSNTNIITDIDNIINGLTSDCRSGFIICGLNEIPRKLTASGRVGSIILGTYFDFPHSPDLNISISYDYGDVKEVTTKGGSTLTNSHYTPNMWGNRAAWEFDGEHKLSFIGRRIFTMNFSFIADSNAFPKDINLTNFESDNYDADDYFANTILKDDTILKVIHLTNGGQLPVILQLDNTSGSEKPDQFSICKIDSNFTFQQTAPNLYSISLRFREIW